MRATVMHGAGDVRVEDVPDATLRDATDVTVRIVLACICGSDLWPYRDLAPSEDGRRMGHEFVGVVEDVGAEVTTLRRGDLVVAPFLFADGSCDFCHEGEHAQCRNGGFWGGVPGSDGGQGEAVRVPFADATLVRLPVAPDDALLPALLTLSDVFSTGHYAALCARVRPGVTAAVVGDGAVGLCGVIAARRLGAERVIVLGHHADRLELARELGATDVVTARGPEAVEQVHELTGGDGAHAVLECAGQLEAFETALAITRGGGALGRVGAPQYASAPHVRGQFGRNITIGGGPAPTRAFIEELLPDVLEGRVQPGRVFDATVALDGVPEGYQAMDERRSLKVLVRP